MNKWQHTLTGFILLVGVYQILRTVFFLNNPDISQNASVEAIAWAWLQGIRFDLSALALINLVPILITGLPLPRRMQPWQRMIGIMLFVLLNSAFIIVNIVDTEYFQFTARRATLNAFELTTDLGNQFWQISSYYWQYSLAMVFTPVIVYLLARLSYPPHSTPRTYGDLATWMLCLLGLIFCARGGWQAKPLIPAHAFLAADGKLAQLSLNSSFTLIKSFDRKTPERLNFYSDWISLKDAIDTLSSVQADETTNFQPLKKGTNVVVILLESFGLEYMGLEGHNTSYTPFLNELAKKGRFFQNHYASGRRSIDAIPSIFASIPSWMDEAFITSQFQTNDVHGLGHSLSSHGYKTKFFHGGTAGTMFMDVMAQQAGFESYIDASTYPNHDKDFDGHWGIFDEPFLAFTIDELSKIKSPFLAGIFTLSSHHPYTIPSQYAGQFPKGDLEIHESIGYADYALKAFFQKAEKTAWYKDTLFVLTADHTSKTNSAYYQSDLGRFRVPLIFFHPGNDLNFLDTTQIAQHVDIKPTIEDLLGFEKDHTPFGSSLARKQKNVAILYTGETYKIVSKNRIIDYHLPDTWRVFKSSDWQLKSPLSFETWPSDLILEKELVKAKVQAFRNGLLDDKLTW